MRTRVKICGMTRVEDAQAAVDNGADALGLVFYPPSPRYVSIAAAQAIAQSLAPFVQLVGLFVNAEPTYVQSVLAQVPLDLLQFHGDETESACCRYHRPYIKAIRVKADTSIAACVTHYPSARGLLLDAYVKGIPGGTGTPFDWSQVPAELNKPLILAGGLTPENVQQAIRMTQVYAVDVSGGVERTKGIKDSNKIHAFMQGVANV